MRYPNNLKTLCLAAAVAVPAMAVADQGALPTFDDYTAKGFLSEYAKLEPVAGDQDAFRYLDPEADFSRYNKLLIDRIKVFYQEDSDYKGIDPDDLKALTDYFHQALVKAMGDAYPVVDEPGPDVLRLRIAVTDLVPNKPEASMVSLVVPFLWVADAGTGVAKGETGSTAFTGEATIEMEALDSVSSQQLGAYIETRVGKKYNWTKGVTEGVTSYVKAYSKWDYTKKAMDFWAQRLRTRMDELHGKAPEES